MAILSSDKLVVVKAFAMGNPLPLDAREIYDSLAEAKEYAATSAVAYAGQTIKVVENNVVTMYNLVPSDKEGENFVLAFAGGGAGGVQNVGTSNTEGNVSVVSANGETTTTQDIPVVGALVNPVVDEDAHTLTLTKLGTTPDKNTEVVIPLGGASPEAGIVSGVKVNEDGISLDITTFNPETESETTTTIKLSGVAGAVTKVDTGTAGIAEITTMGEDGTEKAIKHAIKGAAINPTYDASTKTLTIPVVTGVSAEGAVQTTDVVVDLKTVVANAIVDVTHTEDAENTSAKYEFSYKDATGADQKKTVYETGVRKVEAGETADKIKITTADKTGALTATELLVGAGSVKNPTYEAETRKITLPILQTDGTTQNLEINLGKDMVVKSGSYKADTKEIVLVLTDNSEVKIPAASLVDVYTGGETTTVTVEVSEGNQITAEVRLATNEKNILKKDDVNGGLYVVESDFVETKKAIADAQTAAEKHADDAVAAEVTARDQAIATAKAAAITEAKEYADAELAKEVTARDQAIATAKTAANEYTDAELAKEVTARDQAIATAKSEAEKHADDAVAAEVTARDQAIATAKTAANEYTDSKITQEIKDRDAAIATAKTAANEYTDQQVAGSLADAKKFTTEELAKEVTARDQAIADAKTAANEYTDQQVAAEAKSRDTAIATAKAAAITEAKTYTDTELAKEVTARNNAIATAKDEAKQYADELVAANATAWVDFGAVEA